MEDELDAGCNRRQAGFFAMHCENFARIAKILQSLRNFRYEHFFAMHIFSLSERNFAIIAKVTVHSENLNFP